VTNTANKKRKAISHSIFGLRVVEAKEPLTLKLLQVDIDKAEESKTENVNDKNNFLSCVIAQAATRSFGAEQVAIMRRVAYVAFPGDGHAKRYLVDEKSHETLSKWDRGEHVAEGIELCLRPPSKMHTRAALRKKNRAYAKRHSGEARPITKRKQRNSDPLHNTVRNGNLVRWS
jgi:hypothetical protein